MEGYYTKQEAARILSVTNVSIENYVREGKFTGAISQGHRTYILKDQVDSMLDRLSWQASERGGFDNAKLYADLKVLQHDVEVLKLGLGFGALSKTRDYVELGILRQRSLDLMALNVWTPRQMIGIADDLVSIQESELIMLYAKRGPAAWLPMHKIACRMLLYIEQHKDYPSKSLELLRTRLIKAKERFLALVYACSNEPQETIRHSSRMMGVLEIIGPIDLYILNAILSEE